MWGLQRQEKLKILAMAIHPTAQYPLREISRFCYESPDPHLLQLAPLQWTTVSNSSFQNPHSFCISYKDQQINTMSSLRFRPLCILEFFFFPGRSSIRMVVCLLLGDCKERQHFEFPLDLPSVDCLLLSGLPGVSPCTIIGLLAAIIE